MAYVNVGECGSSNACVLVDTLGLRLVEKMCVAVLFPVASTRLDPFLSVYVTHV